MQKKLDDLYSCCGAVVSFNDFDWNFVIIGKEFEISGYKLFRKDREKLLTLNDFGWKFIFQKKPRKLLIDTFYRPANSPSHLLINSEPTRIAAKNLIFVI